MSEDWRPELAKILKEQLDPIQQHLGKLSAVIEHPPTPSGEGESETMSQRTLYKCHGKDCTYSTEDLGAFVEHVIDERVVPKIPAPTVEEPRWEGEKPKTHSTVKEYLDCPDCAPKFEKELIARGWKKPEEKPAKKKEGLAV